MTATFDFDSILNNAGQDSAPPLHLWHPELSGDIDITIDKQGVWRHGGDVFERRQIPKLFSRILCAENGEYFLKTPVEKWRIQVADAPVLFIHVEQKESSEGPVLSFVGLNEEVVELSEQHPLSLKVDSETGQSSPYIQVREGIAGKLSRNLYYQLVEMAYNDEQAQTLYLDSKGSRYCLGSY